MDINALLQMLQGGGGPSLQGGSGGISAPTAAPMANPMFQMPQFAGAGTNAGPQQAAAMAHQALSVPPPQQQQGGMDPSQIGMFAMLHKMQNQNQPPPTMALNNITDMRGNPMPQSISGAMPNIGGASGLQGLFGRMFGG